MVEWKNPHDHFTTNQSIKEIETELEQMVLMPEGEFIPCTGMWQTEHGFMLSTHYGWILKASDIPGHFTVDRCATEAEGIHQYLKFRDEKRNVK